MVNIPDGYVVAVIPILVSFMVWNGRQFVLYVMKAKEQPSSPPQAPVEFSFKNLNDIIVIIKREFNGHYLTKDAARSEFERVRQMIAMGNHDMRNLFGQPIVALLERENPRAAELLVEKLNRLQRSRFEDRVDEQDPPW